MPSNAIYRCSKCGTEYRPLAAGERHNMCCRLPLERVERGTPFSRGLERMEGLARTPTPTDQPISLQVMEIIPPRENEVDAQAVESLLNTLYTGKLISLEIVGDAGSRAFLARGPADALAHIRHQIQATYDQVTFRILSPDEDPARPSRLPIASAHFKLFRPAYVSLRTYEDGDFLKNDPVRGLVGAFDGLQGDERALAQIILLPAPPHWSDPYQGSARQVEKNLAGGDMSTPSFLQQFVSVMVYMTAVGLGFWAFLAFIRQEWLTFVLAGSLFAGAVAAVMSLYTFFGERRNVDPNLVRAKVEKPAYDVSIRLWVTAETQARADAQLEGIAAAYRQVNMQSGNSLVKEPADFDPQVLAVPRASILNEIRSHLMRLNTAELAALWHLPVGQPVPLVKRNLTRHILPLPKDVSEGVLIGHSIHNGHKIPVHLATSALFHHMFMVAKTQKGKSTLMAHLAAAAMRLDVSLVVIDPHGDLARSVLGRVPRDRVGDVLYLDFNDTQLFVGMNLLDTTQGLNMDRIVENFIHVGRLLWTDYWGPRMEQALTIALLTLLEANEALARDNEPQFTVIDIISLFTLHGFRRRLLDTYIKNEKVHKWWQYYDGLYESLRIDVANPILTKIYRFATHTVIRNVFGQSSSTVNFRELVEQRRILLVNTATGVIGPDAGGLLGAVLIDYINFAMRGQMAIADPAARTRVVIVVDEFQSIPGVNYMALMAELQKMGASFILATQALGQLKTLDEALRPSIKSNIDTLFVFQTSAEDADFLRHELDEAVTGTDIINLSGHSTYVKSNLGLERLPVMHVDTLSPGADDRYVVEQSLIQKPRYAWSGERVEAECRRFQEKWFGDELTYRKAIHNLQQPESSPPNHPNPEAKRSRAKNNADAENRKSQEQSPDADPDKTAKGDEQAPSNAPGATRPANPGGSNEEGTRTENKDPKESTSDASQNTLQVKTTRVEPPSKDDSGQSDETKRNPGVKRLNP